MAKEGLHPVYYEDAQVVCACGNTFTVGSTQKLIRTDICSNCHPFYTGEQRIVDTAGQVDRFMKRLQVGSSMRQTPAAERKTRRPVIETIDE